MKKSYIFLMIVLLGFSFSGCKKSSSDSSTPSVDLAANAVGTYTGTMTGGLDGTVVITKQSSTVTIALSSGGQAMMTIPGCTVSDGGNGTIELLNSSMATSATVNGKSLNLSISTLTFTGTKP